MRRAFLAAGVLSAMLAGCGREPPRPVPVAAPPAPVIVPVAVAPAKPAWVAKKVVPAAIDVRATTLTVIAAEGWSQVALRSGVPAGALMAANGLAATAQLHPGQVLKVPAGRVHTVVWGQTGIAIARAYGVNWSKVIALNRLVPPYTIEIGDRLLLPSRAAVAAMSVEDRARAFRIDIDDLITGAEPAGGGPAPKPAKRPPVAVASLPPVRRNPVPTRVEAAPPHTASLAPLPALPTGAPEFEWPVEGRILSGFGPKPGGRYNDGINLKASPGTAVRAAADGVVAYAGDAVAGFGNLILIKHADGWVSAYGHNSALLVARGARVSRGDVIARSGATGAVDEPQVHFELRRGRAATDPVKLLPARG